MSAVELVLDLVTSSDDHVGAAPHRDDSSNHFSEVRTALLFLLAI